MRTVAALYVDPRGVYSTMPGVECWGEDRDARAYAGPHPVVAHPPCARWCRLAGLVEARWGHRRGEDGGCFEAALGAVRRWGGVLEHPAYTDAWAAFGLPRPVARGPWQRGLCGGWVCHVDQANYGHRARKSTWLYACQVDPPTLDWTEGEPDAWCGWAGNHSRGRVVERLGKRESNATPRRFAATLLEIARSAA